MVSEMGIAGLFSQDAAAQKMNELWKGLSFLGDDDLIYHQDVDYWADVIVFGK